MVDERTRRVFVGMVREEWRLHSQLFSGGRFAAFPLVIAIFVAGATELLVVTGTTPATVFAGLHALVFVFGLHTGSIGFAGRDAIRNLLGDLTLLVFSGRTLPLSRQGLLGLFVVKDAVYYALLFLLPMALGTLPALLEMRAAPTVSSIVGAILLLWATLWLTFVIGIGATLAGLGITGRGVPGLAVFALLVVAASGAWVSGFEVLAYTPYGLFVAQTPFRLGGSVVLVLAVFSFAAVTFDASGHRPARTVGPSFRRWWRRIDDPLATKTLLDVHRSSGGFGKVLFSGAILFGVTASLVDLAGQITGVSPSVGISFGAILGLSGFTTYNWLTQADDVDSYAVHPLGVTDVFDAKFRAFLLLGPLVGLAFYALALAWRGGPLLEAIVGAIVLVGVTCYIFGTTVYLTGLSPNEFLFDTLLFGVFGLAMIVPLVPVLVVGFALAPVSWDLLATLGVVGVALGGIGLGLYRRSRQKWSNRYRQR